jgi:hypothetical protein
VWKVEASSVEPRLDATRRSIVFRSSDVPQPLVLHQRLERFGRERLALPARLRASSARDQRRDVCSSLTGRDSDGMTPTGSTVLTEPALRPSAQEAHSWPRARADTRVARVPAGRTSGFFEHAQHRTYNAGVVSPISSGKDVPVPPAEHACDRRSRLKRPCVSKGSDSRSVSASRRN